MARIAVAILWFVIVGSAHAAYMKGTLTLDDGRTAALTLRPFRMRGSENVSVKTALMKCSGDACFRPTGDLGFELPFAGGYELAFDNPVFPFGLATYYCATQEPGLKRPGVCRIQSPVICHVEDTHLTPIIQVVATGMLDVHRTTPTCLSHIRRGQ